MPNELTKAQGRRLLKLHLTDDGSGGAWRTMQALMDKGMVAVDQDGALFVREQGRIWCDKNHLEV